MTKYTPGPWKTWQDGSFDSVDQDLPIWIVAPKPEFRTIVEVSVGKRPTIEANARLIAAAPELLAMCELALDWLDEACDDDDLVKRTEIGMQVTCAIKAAIAKAKGE